MAAKRYDWGGSHLPMLENHSRCKHDILKDYVIRYMRVRAKILLRFKKKDWNLTFVDGFAGGGKYDCGGEEVDGSPLVLLRAVEEAGIYIQNERRENNRDVLNIKADFIFVEKNEKAVNFLRQILRASDAEHSQKARVLHGTFGKRLDSIIRDIQNKSGGKKGTAIFVLDQYGFSDVLFFQIQKIMRKLRAEIILTFSIDALVTYFEKGVSALRKIGFDDTDIDAFRKAENPDRCRQAIQFALSEKLCDMRGCFFTPFLIQGDTSHWGYWLVHLSTHYRARDEMMCIHWGKANKLVHYGSPGTDMLGYRSKSDQSYTKQPALSDAFNFNADAKEKCEDALRNELPAIITEKREINYRDLWEEICNHTPASKEMVDKILLEEVEGQELIILSKEEKNIRNIRNIRDDHIIKANPQKTIVF